MKETKKEKKLIGTATFDTEPKRLPENLVLVTGAEIEVTNINPLTGKPWNEPFYMCDLQESEDNQKNNNQ